MSIARITSIIINSIIITHFYFTICICIATTSTGIWITGKKIIIPICFTIITSKTKSTIWPMPVIFESYLTSTRTTSVSNISIICMFTFSVFCYRSISICWIFSSSKSFCSSSTIYIQFYFYPRFIPSIITRSSI